MAQFINNLVDLGGEDIVVRYTYSKKKDTHYPVYLKKDKDGRLHLLGEGTSAFFVTLYEKVINEDGTVNYVEDKDYLLQVTQTTES